MNTLDKVAEEVIQTMARRAETENMSPIQALDNYWYEIATAIDDQDMAEHTGYP